MMQCCLSLSLFLFYVELEPTNVRKNSHGCSEGIVQVFLPQLCWCYSVFLCVCACVVFIFLYFYFSFQKWASTLCYSPFIKPVFKQLLLGADL